MNELTEEAWLTLRVMNAAMMTDTRVGLNRDFNKAIIYLEVKYGRAAIDNALTEIRKERLI